MTKHFPGRLITTEESGNLSPDAEAVIVRISHERLLVTR